MTPLLTQELEQAIRATVEKHAAPFPIDRFEVRIDEDSNGEEALFIDVWHPLLTTPVDSRLQINVMVAVSGLLRDRREKWHSYVWQHFSDGQTFGSVA
jgi:hypothetical protein